MNQGRMLMNLEKPLSAPFVVHKRSIGFSKCARRNNNMCFLRGWMRRMVDDDDVFTFCQELIYYILLCMAVEIIFNYDHRIGMFVDHGIKGGVQPVTAHHGETHRVAFWQG